MLVLLTKSTFSTETFSIRFELKKEPLMYVGWFDFNHLPFFSIKFKANCSLGIKLIKLQTNYNFKPPVMFHHYARYSNVEKAL